MNTLYKLGALTLALGLNSPSMAQSLSLTPTADTFIQNGTPNTNYGTAPTLLARIADAEGLSRADYLQFDLSQLPAGTLISVRLRVYGRHDPGGTGVAIRAFPMVNNVARWTETAVTWNNGQASTGVTFASNTAIATTTVTSTAQYYEWDVTSYINSRRAAGYATIGLYPATASTYRVTFNSKEATANRPQLVAIPDGGNPLPGVCPTGFTPREGVNTGFMHEGVRRGFVLHLPANISTPRPVIVSLTGAVESTNQNLNERGGMAALVNNGYIVIGPNRRCSGEDPNADGTGVNGGDCNRVGTNGWIWEAWNEGRTFGAARERWKTDAGADSRFLEAVVRCAARAAPVDSRRIYVGGISSGAAMANRALLFNSGFWAGGFPFSGEWYVTQDNGNAYPGADEFAARRQAVIDQPTKIFQGRVGPYPLAATLQPMIVLTLWGGTNDTYFCGGVLCFDFRPPTQVSSNYFSAQANVVHVACSSTHGHQWPNLNRTAFNLWVADTLSRHPKGTAKSAFVLSPAPPSGYTCRVGRYTDHYSGT